MLTLKKSKFYLSLSCTSSSKWHHTPKNHYATKTLDRFESQDIITRYQVLCCSADSKKFDYSAVHVRCLIPKCLSDFTIFSFTRAHASDGWLASQNMNLGILNLR